MLEKEPFVNYTLEEDRKKEKDVFSVRLNQDERLILEDLKKCLDLKSDSTALKIGFKIGHKVILSLFGRELSKYLFKKERARFDK